MSQFYGTLRGQAKTTATRRGGKSSGILTQAASWAGAIEVSVHLDNDGKERFDVYQIPWKGKGVHRHIASGILGQ